MESSYVWLICGVICCDVCRSFKSTMEGFILKFQRNLLQKMHRQMFCCQDKWIGLTILDIRKIEADTAAVYHHGGRNRQAARKEGVQ